MRILFCTTAIAGMVAFGAAAQTPSAGEGTTTHGARAAAEDQTDMVGSPGAPAEAPAGYVEVEVPPSVDALIGADVYDGHGESIGQVGDLVIGGEDTVTHVLLDIGGILGVESHTVALEMIQHVHLFYNAQTESMRVHLTMTEAQLESLPEYEGRGEYSP